LRCLPLIKGISIDRFSYRTDGASVTIFEGFLGDQSV
jgi:hypothetical protein